MIWPFDCVNVFIPGAAGAARILVANKISIIKIFIFIDSPLL
jgi:hypothetical protein